MPYYQMNCGSGTRTYKARDAADVTAHHAKHGMNTYELKRVTQAEYDAERARDGDIVGDKMDLTKS